MIGNPSVRAFVVCTLALHATLISQRGVVAEEASVSFKDYHQAIGSGNRDTENSRRRQKRHLRRRAHSDSSAELSSASTQKQHRKLACSNKWHVDMATQDGCSNDDNYPPSWLQAHAVNNMFFDTPDLCCTRMFPGRSCEHYDNGCVNAGPVPSPSTSSSTLLSESKTSPASAPEDKPTPLPTASSQSSQPIKNSTPAVGSTSATPATSSCTNKWHVDMVSQVGCSNDDNYPSSWRAQMFFDTPDLCCTRMFPGKACPQNDVGCVNGDLQATTPSSSSTLLPESNSPPATAPVKKTPMPTALPQSSIPNKESTPGGSSSGTSATSKTTTCSNKWHVDMVTQDGCSNDENYPASWASFMFYDTPELCCTRMFPGRSCAHNNSGCGNADPVPTLSSPSSPLLSESKSPPTTAPIKKTPLPTAPPQSSAPITKPTPGELSSTATSTTSSCANKWHIDMTSQDGCSNDEEYPPEWINPSMEIQMFFDTPELCCTRMFPGSSCAHNDRGCGNSAPVPTPSSISSLSESKTPPAAAPGDKNMPSPMASSQNSKPNKTPTPGGSSSASATSAASTCANKWHPDMVSRDGCSNDEEYPSEWLEPMRVKLMFFDTPELCCTRMFPGKSCAHNDRGCGNGNPASSPSKSNQKNPTNPVPRPSKSHNSPPSRRPTRRPVKPRVYWMNSSNGICVDEEIEPRPDWIKDTYSVYETCCMESWDQDACQMAKPSDLQETWGQADRPSRPMAMTPFSFYVDPLSGLCAEETEIPKPNWVTKTYHVYESCCKDEAVSNESLCVKARPTKINGISFGTVAPTQTPDPKYYVDPGSGMCVDEADKPKPSHVTASFETYNRCCILASRNTEICLDNIPQAKTISDFTTSEPTSDSATSEPTPSPSTDYYLQQVTAICVDLNSVTHPGWVEKTFGTDYDSCCETSWDVEKCMSMKPTMPPTATPTGAPITPWPTETALCPESYDSSIGSFGRGSETELNSVIWRCTGHAVYCNNQGFQPPLADPGPKITYGSQTSGVIIAPNIDSSGLWDEVWERVSICAHPPSLAPTMVPTSGMPTCASARWHPGDVDRRICTNSPDYPETWNTPPLSKTYFADTAEQCCNKFYDGVRCRMRDVCL